MTGAGHLHPDSTVCALVPHYRCERWLAQAVESLLTQTRPPDRVVVIDDASPEPPLEILADFPEVTLMATATNGGPYRAIQSVIDRTTFDAYLFQDADDWSAPDRLEQLLAEGLRHRAEMVGSHEVRVLAAEGDVVAVRYPLDVNQVLGERPSAFPLLHPTSVVARSLLERIGGFATGMRFSGDAELLRRAGHAGRVVNLDAFAYFRRKREGSLTLGSDTALGSPTRRRVQRELNARAGENARRVAAGVAPDLAPWRTAPPVELEHLAGPPPDHRGPIRCRRRSSASPPGGGAPIFLIGAPRAGHGPLGWALAQHPSLSMAVDAQWLARSSADVVAAAAAPTGHLPPAFAETMAAALLEVAGSAGTRPGGRVVAAGWELTEQAHALASLFPGARFLNVVRSFDDAMDAVGSAPTSGRSHATAEGAARQWAGAVEVGLLLEEALGPEAVLRIDYGSLVDDPATVVARCWEFLAEAPHPGCVGPLEGLTQAHQGGVRELPPALRVRVGSLEERLTTLDPEPGDAQRAARRLASRFHAGRASGWCVRGPLVERVGDLVSSGVPHGSTMAVVSRGDPRLLEVADRTGWHLPSDVSGVYCGHHPADGSAALGHLLDLHRRGAEYLVVPSAHLWWLTYYDELRHHLVAESTLVAFHEEAGAVFRLGLPASPTRPSRPSPPRFVPVPAPRSAEVSR